jgi:hypothetical protein
MASSSASSSAYPQQQQQQQQQRGWNPMASAMGAAGMNDATAQMGLQFGSHVLGAGQNYVEQTVRWTAASWVPGPAARP